MWHEKNKAGTFKKEIDSIIVPKTMKKKARRKLGILEGKGRVSFAADFKMTTEEFLGY